MIVKAYFDIMTSHKESKMNPTFFKAELSFLSLTPKSFMLVWNKTHDFLWGLKKTYSVSYVLCLNREQNYQSDQG